MDLELIWNNLGGKGTLDHERRINLEYAVRLQVVKILIKEAEHLMNYLSLVVIEINSSNGHVSVHKETPEPLFSKIANKLEKPSTKEVSKESSPLPVAINI